MPPARAQKDIRHAEPCHQQVPKKIYGTHSVSNRPVKHIAQGSPPMSHDGTRFRVREQAMCCCAEASHDLSRQGREGIGTQRKGSSST